MQCPITQEEIEVYGITCNGQIYEYDAIKKWLTIHETDPLTNEYLPNKFVNKVEKEVERILGEEYIKRIAQNTLENSKIYLRGFRSLDSYRRDLEKIAGYRENIKAQEKQWNSYHDMRIKYIYQKEDEARRKRQIVCIADYYMDRSPSFEEQRPAETGNSFEMIDLSNSWRKVISNLNFKCESFSGANLSNHMFHNCMFSHVKFIGTNMRGLYFEDCCFRGDVFFVGAEVDSWTTFDNCEIEDFDWKMYRDKKKFQLIAGARGLKDDYITKE